jgi:hypothetical protein
MKSEVLLVLNIQFAFSGICCHVVERIDISVAGESISSNFRIEKSSISLKDPEFLE